jgi:hypothetical protein
MQITSVRYRKLVSLRGGERKALEAENQVERDAVPGAPRFVIEQTTCPPKAKVTRSNRVGCASSSYFSARYERSNHESHSVLLE